jgi:hypothetical protein
LARQKKVAYGATGIGVTTGECIFSGILLWHFLKVRLKIIFSGTLIEVPLKIASLVVFS